MNRRIYENLLLLPEDLNPLRDDLTWITGPPTPLREWFSAQGIAGSAPLMKLRN
jgi:hypothetical protein